MDSLISAFDVEKDALERQLADTLKGCDDGELFMEYSQSEGLVFDNGKLKAGNFNTDQGFGLRACCGRSLRLCPFGRNDPGEPQARQRCGSADQRWAYTGSLCRWSRAHQPAFVF